MAGGAQQLGPGTPESATAVVEELGPFLFVQPPKGQRLTSDSVLLAEFASPISPDDRVVDLGTGTGAIPLMIATRFFDPASSTRPAPTDGQARFPHITGVEIDPEAASYAIRNIEANGLGHSITVIEGDYRDLTSRLPAGSFTVAVSNPPYMKAGSARLSPVKARAGARAEINGTLADLLDTATHLLADGGRLFMVFPLLRQAELTEGLKARGLALARVSLVHTPGTTVAKVFLVEAIKGPAGASNP